MNIKSENYKIELSHDELWTIGFSIQKDIQESIKTHWVNHQNNWKNNEKIKLQIMKDIFYSLGRPDIYENIYLFAEETFNNNN